MVASIIGEEIFQDLVTATLKDVTGLVLPGSNIALALIPHVSRAFFAVIRKRKKAEQPAVMDALAGMSFSASYDTAAKAVAETDFDEATQLELVKYLSAIPMTARQALHRSNDGGQVTTLLSQLPRSPEQMARFVPRRTPRFQPGYRLPGYDYELVTLLGQGGFAEVWKARNTELKGQPPVALKFCLDETLLPSLKREIQLLDRLGGYAGDKDFVRLKQTAYSAEPPFLVYEYMEGGNLANWLETFEGKKPKPKEVVTVLKMVARAVALAHGNNIVHCDLKPANLMVTAEGRVKVADFGIGRVVAESEAAGDDGFDTAANPTLLQGAFTPLYSDPMRHRQAAPGPQDDVYALGVIAYQLLLGDVGLRMEGGWRRYLEAAKVPAPLVEIIDTCVAPAGQRYVDAGALLAALEQIGKARKPKAKAKPEPKPEPQPEPALAPEAAAVRYCYECGKPVVPGNAFCTSCGHKLG